jgi:hypothetical protein
MRVIPYQPKDIDEPRELVAAIRARRGGTLLNLDRMLLHSPPLAAGWNGFLRAVRTELAVSPKLRELAICAVALLNRADFDPTPFDAGERAVVALTTEMTRAVEVSPATMDAVRAALADDRHIVEIVAVIATYNMVSRFLVALGVEPE